MPIRNTLADLHNMLMGQMERLDDEDLTDEELERESRRTNSMCKIGKIICNNAANMIEAQKLAYDAGYIDYTIWNESLEDIGKYEIDNCFKTAEEASFRREQIKVYNELKNFADGNNDSTYYITYDYSAEELEIEQCCWIRNLGQIYFSSFESAEKAIKEVGEAIIKKYLFGIEISEDEYD